MAIDWDTFTVAEWDAFTVAEWDTFIIDAVAGGGAISPNYYHQHIAGMG